MVLTLTAAASTASPQTAAATTAEAAFSSLQILSNYTFFFFLPLGTEVYIDVTYTGFLGQNKTTIQHTQVKPSIS
jgi:hypothetical protein